MACHFCSLVLAFLDEKNEKIKDSLRKKMSEYLARAETLKQHLASVHAPSASSSTNASGNGTTAAAKAKQVSLSLSLLAYKKAINMI